MIELRERSLHEVAPEIRKADLLLFRGQGWISRFIGAAARSKYSHAAKVDRWGTELFCCEVREFKGGRIVTLASQIMKFPGQIDVFTSNPTNQPGYDREESAAYMRRFAGQDYGWRAVGVAALQHLPLARVLISHNYALENGDAPQRPPFCSAACASADRNGGGIDPVPHLADRFTLPGDLAHSNFYRYYCTLVGV